LPTKGPIYGLTPSSPNGFELERSGERISLVDADGSVYEGQVLEQSEFVGSAEASAFGVSGIEADAPLKAKTDEQPAREANVSSNRVLRFRATGTNRTLRQPVSVDAVVRSSAPRSETAAVSRARGIPAAPSPRSAAPALAASSAPTEAQVEAWQMEGRIRVGTNLSSLRAIRRSPERR
jgi:hypothetical protein